MTKALIVLAIGCLSYLPGVGQATVFSVFQDPLQEADRHFAAGRYAQAATAYTAELSRKPNDGAMRRKLAQARYRSKDYAGALSAYDQCVSAGATLTWDDLYYYAEANATLGRRTVALDYYKRCLAQQPDHELIAKKIWRLTNVQYLYEDSAHYAVRLLNINTGAGELCAVPYNDGFVFTSNRKGAGIVERFNGKSNTPFYKLYLAHWKEDTATHMLTIGKPITFATSLRAGYNTGPVAFYQGGKQMVFVTSAEKAGADGKRTLGLYFATLQGKKWKVTTPFPFNSERYSIHDVSINDAGTVLYFSSDMAGGEGGKDIYTSQWSDGKWSKPRNLGDAINTPLNEAFPYLHHQLLYFSSDGHPGMGQLDIFRALVEDDGFGEPENLGYPVNSPYDDFGLALDTLGTHGYLSSNRKHGGYDDDVYEVDLDLQTYPFTIACVLKFKEHTWSSSSGNLLWPNARVALMDSGQGNPVFTTKTDATGKFSIVIPYFGRYYVQVTDDEGIAYKASFELSKYQGETSVHEIVIVKDIFKKNNDRK
jgi:tetratricopeptide (TPR) repeat protein